MKPGLGLSWALRVSTNLDINYLTSDGETMAAHLNIYLWTTYVDNWEHLKTSCYSVTLLCTMKIEVSGSPFNQLFLK